MEAIALQSFCGAVLWSSASADLRRLRKVRGLCIPCLIFMWQVVGGSDIIKETGSLQGVVDFEIGKSERQKHMGYS